MAVLNEVYIGRLPEIEDMLQDIHNIREEYKEKGNVSIIKSTKDFEKHVEDMWGFKAFLFDIYIDDVPNAFTWCVGSCVNVDTRDAIECTSKGYRFSPKSNVAAKSMIATSLLVDDTMSDEEILAIILHEVGHSFVERAAKVNDLMNAYRRTYLNNAILNVLLSILVLNPINFINSSKLLLSLNTQMNTIMTKISKALKNVPLLRHAAMGTKQMEAYVSKKINDYFTLLSRNNIDSNYIRKLEKTKQQYDDIIKKNNGDPYGKGLAMGRSKERLSDDFANMYGFGPQLATGLIKMGNPYKYGVLSTVEATDLQKRADDLVMQIYAIIDEHPSNVDRVLAMVDALEQDYKSLKAEPAVKAAMKEDLDALKAIANDLKKTQKLLKDYNNKYMQATAKKNANKGNSETKREKEFNDRDKINKEWEKYKIKL